MVSPVVILIADDLPANTAAVSQVIRMTSNFILTTSGCFPPAPTTRQAGISDQERERVILVVRGAYSFAVQTAALTDAISAPSSLLTFFSSPHTPFLVVLVD